MSNDPDQPAPTQEQQDVFALMRFEIESLTQRLENMTRQRDDAAVALLNAGQKHDADRNEWRAEFDRLLRRSNEAAHDATRARNRFVMLATHAHDAFHFFIDSLMPVKLEALTDEYRDRLKAAREMLVLIQTECT